MTKAERIVLIKKIEEEKNCKLISLILGDKTSIEPNLNLMKQIEDDLIRYLYEILNGQEHAETMTLFLYSRGGNTEIPSKIINLLRGHCKKLNVIIPYRAHSAATMIAVGCDEIFMNEISELGPIDPSITTIFNPQNPINPLQRVPIEAESILSFRDAMKKDFKLWFRPAKIASMLSQHINPIVIGTAYRYRALSKSVILKFLKYHIKGNLGFIKRRVTANKLLRSDSHAYAINIDEAKLLGLNVTLLTGELKKNVWKLFEGYEEELNLKNNYNPTASLGSNQNKTDMLIKALIETCIVTYKFETKINLTKNPPNNVNWLIEEGWIVA